MRFMVGTRFVGPGRLEALTAQLEAAASELTTYIANAESFHRAVYLLEHPQCPDAARKRYLSRIERLGPINSRRPTLSLEIQSYMTDMGLMLLKSDGILGWQVVLAELRMLYREACECLDSLEAPSAELAAEQDVVIEGDKSETGPERGATLEDARANMPLPAVHGPRSGPALKPEARQRLVQEGYRKVSAISIQEALRLGNPKRAKDTLEQAQGLGQVEDFVRDGAKFWVKGRVLDTLEGDTKGAGRSISDPRP